VVLTLPSCLFSVFATLGLSSISVYVMNFGAAGWKKNLPGQESKDGSVGLGTSFYRVYLEFH
jgi:hypothetical protein